MPVTLDTTANSSASATNTLTFAHTCSGSERILVVGVASEDTTSDTNVNVSTVTYGGVSMSLVGSQQIESVGGNRNGCAMYILVNPLTGANNVVITMAGTAQTIIGMSISYTGARQSSQPEASGGAHGSSTTPSTAAVTVTPNALVVDMLVSGSAGNTITLDQGTQRFNIDVGPGTLDAGGSDILKVAAGSQTKSWTISASSRWGIVAAAIAEDIPVGGFFFMSS